MSAEERKQLWQQRINAFQTSGDTDVKAWCHRNEISHQSMYRWMRRLASESIIDVQQTTQWMAFSQSNLHNDPNSSLRIHIGNVSIEIQEDFNRTLFQEVLEILQHHVR